MSFGKQNKSAQPIDLTTYGSPTLDPWAQKYLKDRGISLEVAKLNNLRSLTAAETAALYGPRYAFPSLLIPYSKDYGTARINVPKKRAKDKFQTTAGQGARIYRPIRPKGKRRLTDRKLIVEGPFKALSCASQGYDAIGIGGCWCWQKGREPLPELKALPWKEQHVVPIFDADVTDKMQVGFAYLGLGDWLTSQGAHAFYLRMPKIAGATTGVDDYLAKKGADALRVRIEERGEEWSDSAAVTKLRNDLLRNTEGGLAQRFLQEHADKVLFDPEEGIWYVYSYSGIWEAQPKSLPDVLELMQETVLGIAAEATTITNKATRIHRQKWGMQCDNLRTMRGAIGIASASPTIRTRFEDMDRQSDIVGVQNGILDLRTQKLIAATKEQRITRRLSVPFLPDAKCPVWAAFIKQVMCDENDKPSKELALFMQDLCGYILTGENPQRYIFFLYGIGRNGKSKFLEAMLQLMGDYGEASQSAMLMRRSGFERDSEAPQPFMMKLRGKRYVTASEVREGAAIDESVIKMLTGEDTTPMRDLHSAPVRFTPKAKIVVRCNHRPKIETKDEATWDRVIEIPFNHRVRDEDQDFELANKLRAELPGILNWSLVGAARYYKAGRLIVPESVKRQVAAYKAAMDSINRFCDERTRKRKKARTDRTALADAYEKWCAYQCRPGIDVRPKPRHEFYDQLEKMGFKPERTPDTRFFRGIEVIE